MSTSNISGDLSAGKKGISLLRWQARNPPAEPTTSFQGKTVLIIDADSSLGHQAAIKFAALGASSLILGFRSIRKAEAAKLKIEKLTACQPSVIRTMLLDMSTFSSVKSFARQVSQEVETLDIALLNADFASAGTKASPDGYEMSLQVNVLSTALLGFLLLPKLRESAAKTGDKPHLVLMTSVAHVYVKAYQVPMGLLAGNHVPPDLWPKAQYGFVRLQAMYVAEALAHQARKPNGELEFIVSVCDPGFCRSGIGHVSGWLLRHPVLLVHSFLARTAEQGSRTLVSATTLGEDSHGKLWSNDVFTRQDGLVQTKEGKKVQAKSWAEILEIVRKESSDVGATLKLMS
ncbi:hypothetical protein P7C71_g1603, partial [Lecanoromycetidae sp. Uapishka_2]